MVEPTLLSANQTAEILGVTLNNLRQLQHRKLIKWVKREGKNVYYAEPDVLALLDKRQRKKV